MSIIEATTTLFLEANKGDTGAANRLFPVIYAELRSLAGQQLRRRPADFTLQPTALVHEVYLRLIDQRKVDWEGKTHFFAMAANITRRILVDHARRRLAKKRKGNLRRVDFSVAFDKQAESIGFGGDELVELDKALSSLTEFSERQVRIVELFYFSGLGVEETATVLGVSPRTVKSDLRFARAWLLQKMDR